MQLATSIPESAAAKPRPQVDFSAWGLRAAAITYLSIMILIPIYVVFMSGLQGGFEAFWASISNAQAASALRLTLLSAAIMTLINMLMGTITAYVLVRYR